MVVSSWIIQHGQRSDAGRTEERLRVYCFFCVSAFCMSCIYLTVRAKPVLETRNLASKAYPRYSQSTELYEVAVQEYFANKWCFRDDSEDARWRRDFTLFVTMVPPINSVAGPVGDGMAVWYVLPSCVVNRTYCFAIPSQASLRRTSNGTFRLTSG